jgi:hypothetical protein
MYQNVRNKRTMIVCCNFIKKFTTRNSSLWRFARYLFTLVYVIESSYLKKRSSNITRCAASSELFPELLLIERSAPEEKLRDAALLVDVPLVLRQK